MRGILLSYPPYGHVTPAVAVAAELVKRGDEIVFFATNQSRPRVAATGARFEAYGPDHDVFNPTPPTSGLFSDMERLLRLSEQLLPSLRVRVEAERPDYLVLDTKAIWGRLLAQMLHLPAVTTSVVFAIRPGVIGAGDLTSQLYAGAPAAALLEGLCDFGRYFERARHVDATLGTSSPDILTFLGNPQRLNVIFTSRLLQPGSEMFEDGAYKFVGLSSPPDRDAGSSFDWTVIDTTRPLVYVSLGTTFNDAPGFYRACFDAFAQEPWQIVLSTGGAPTDTLGPPPPNVYVSRFVPQLEVLRRASAFVTHGGMNSANEGLYFDVPMLVVPQRGDQFIVAARLQELGAGLAVRNDEVSPARLRNGVQRLLRDDSFRTSVRRLGDDVRAGGGAARAAECILAVTR